MKAPCRVSFRYRLLMATAIVLITGLMMMSKGCGDGGGGALAVSESELSKVVYYLYDHRGDLTALVDGTGAVVHERAAYPYGEERQTKDDTSQSVLVDYVHTGKEYDAETGMIYFGGRYYSPQLARWVTPDPLFLEMKPTRGIETPLSYNLYAYARNNPISFFDPDGLVDLKLYPSKDDIYKYADKVKSVPGIFTVGGHGDPMTIVDPDGKPILPANLAAMITNHHAYVSGNTVRLISCNTGTGGAGYKPYAQRLADVMNVPVIAPDNFAWITARGKFFVAPFNTEDISKEIPDLNNMGSWITYHPHSDVSQNVAAPK